MIFGKKKPEENLDDLNESRDHIKSLLSNLEQEYNNAAISEDSYNEIKEKNTKKLQEVETKIKGLGGNIEGPKPVINGHYENNGVKAKETDEKPEKSEEDKPDENPKVEVPGLAPLKEHKKKKEESPKEEEAKPGEKPDEKPKAEVPGLAPLKEHKKKKESPKEEETEPAEKSDEKPKEEPKEEPPEEKEKPKKEKPKKKAKEGTLDASLTGVPGYAGDKPSEEKPKKKAKEGTLAASVTGVPGYAGDSAPEEGEKTDTEETEEKEAEEEKPEEKPEEKAEAKPAATTDIDIKLEKSMHKVNFEMEKLKAILDSVKESRGVVDERLQRLTENIGELRSMIYQKEGQLDELQSKTTRLDELMTNVKPENFTKELTKRDTQLSETETRLEKTETKVEEMMTIVKDIRKVMMQLGNLDNVIDVSRKTADRLLKIENLTESAERYSGDVQKAYIEMSKGLEEIERVKANQERLDGAMKELSASVDGVSDKLEKYATVGDMMEIKETTNMISKELENVKNFISSRIPVLETLSEPLKKLKEQKEEIEVILNSLDEKYSEGKIAEDEYSKIKENNTKKLEEIEKELKKEWKRIERTRKRVNVPIPGTAKPSISTEQKEKAPSAEKPETSPTPELKPKAPKEESPKEEEAKPGEKPDEKPKEEPKEEPPEEKEKPPEKPEKPKKGKKISRTESMLDELEDLLKMGLITKEAFEKTKATISGKK
jgi:DNA repair exonuclease SbcCD ATPase subunit